MNICILGWYGTETLGDRAILDGIINIFAAIEPKIVLSIGSLHPIVTERTLFEDMNFYQRHTTKINAITFDVKDKHALHSVIKQSDCVIMGGGPLMDLPGLYIIQHAFRYAKKYGIATALIGCGYGPLKRTEYIKCVHNIVRYSDLIIMRSESCKRRITSICREKDKEKIYDSMDPAAISVIEYKRQCLPDIVEDNQWLMNVRDLDYVYGTKDYYYPRIRELISSVTEQVPKLCLMPMHTFSIGGDDRYVQNKVAQELNLENLTVIQKPLNLHEAYDRIRNAFGCIGMRYHSVLFQTYLNGNNYIVDYTDSMSGKINAFLHMIDEHGFYNERYTNILSDNASGILIRNNFVRFSFDESDEIESKRIYVDRIKKVVTHIYEH